ncbi:MAG: LamG-like jellyroll fold domain-containing protein, partial [Patescibacteria group bacterium]|nr:LamG-like jellyroll fold domain-containing protein [Patescibacteria group bacterium]
MNSQQSRIKKFFVFFLLGLVIGSFSLAASALALETGLEYGTASGLGTQDLRVTIMNIIRVVLGLLGVIALVIIIYGGYVWMTAGGNAERVETAKKILTNAVIGLVIILASFSIASFIINQLNEALGPPPAQDCNIDNVGDTQGCYRCRDLGGGNYGWRFDDTIAGCSGTTVACGVSAIVPNSPPAQPKPLNTVVRVWFNYPNITNIEDIQVINQTTGQAVNLTRTVNGTMVELVPVDFCAAPDDTLNCFAAETTYQVVVGDDSITCGGQGLICTTNCLAEFTTGDFVDTAAPEITFIDQQICRSTDIQLKALVNDDYGIAAVSFTDNTNLFTIGFDFDVRVPPQAFATINWDTSSYTIGQIINVSATAIDYDAHATSESLDLVIREAHCCNAVKDADETGVDCGGLGCEPCVPVIEWVSPLDGSPGNLITIHGRHFNDVPGTINFLGDPDDGGADDAQGINPSTVNPACTNYWQDSEVVIVVPNADSGPIELVRADSLSDRTDQAPGSNIRDFERNSIQRPGLCRAVPNSGEIEQVVDLYGVRLSPFDQVLFGAVQAGGVPSVDGSGLAISGAKVPAIGDGTVGLRVNSGIQFSNPLSFIVGQSPQGSDQFECSSDSLSCSPDQSKCNPNQFCNSSCECEARTVCDIDNFQTPTCEPDQGTCPAGWYCYYPTTLGGSHAPDNNKEACYCYQAQMCDNPALAPSLVDPACHPDSSFCPDGYICDPNSNCTCQTDLSLGFASAYGWFFQSGIKPGVCSSDEGMCVPNSEFCGFDQYCEAVSCNCATIPQPVCTVDDQAFWFRGSSYFSLENANQLNLGSADFSIGFWLKNFGSGTNFVLAKDGSSGNGYAVSFIGQNYLTLILDDGPNHELFNLPLTAIANFNQWNYFVFTVDRINGQINGYINGELILEQDLPNNFGSLDNSRVFKVGCVDTAGNYDCDTDFSITFSIDDLAFYNKALSAEEVGYLALDRLVASNNLIAFWRFNGSFADELNQHNGQIEGQNPGYNVGHFLCEADSGDTGGILCDSVLETPVCDPSNAICPLDQICNPDTCYCQIAPDLGTESTYTWSFTTNSFAPRVVELCNRSAACISGAISSPTPFSREGTQTAGFVVANRIDDGAVPVDSMVSVTFTEKMNEASLNANTVIVQRCNSASENLNLAACSTQVVGLNGVEVSDCSYNSQEVSCVHFQPSLLLDQNSWYLVTLDGNNIYGQNGVKLIGNNLDNTYRWVFKTRDSDALSQVACVEVQPVYQISRVVGDQKSWTATAIPQDFYCVDMRPDSCGWDWDTNESSPVRAELEQQTSPNAHKAISTAYLETIPDPPVDIIAQCTVPTYPANPVSGQGFLTIDFSSPYVIDRFPDCGTACLNARIGATFSQPMQDDTVTNAIELYDCGTDPKCDAHPSRIVDAFQKPVAPDPAEAANTYIGDVECFDFSGDGEPDYCLLPDRYYRVVIRGGSAGVLATNNRTLSGLNYNDPTYSAGTDFDSYSWVFRTQSNYGLCLPERIDVIPPDRRARIDQLIGYAAKPLTAPDACDPNGQRLSPFSWAWDWDTQLTSRQFTPFCTGSSIADFLSIDVSGNQITYCVDRANNSLRRHCGNFVREIGEDCDDGNLINGDGCSNTCLNEGSVAEESECGDGVIGLGEECEPSLSSSYCDANTCLWNGTSACEYSINILQIKLWQDSQNYLYHTDISDWEGPYNGDDICGSAGCITPTVGYSFVDSDGIERVQLWEGNRNYIYRTDTDTWNGPFDGSNICGSAGCITPTVGYSFVDSDGIERVQLWEGNRNYIYRTDTDT